MRDQADHIANGAVAVKKLFVRVDGQASVPPHVGHGPENSVEETRLRFAPCVRATSRMSAERASAILSVPVNEAVPGRP